MISDESILLIIGISHKTSTISEREIFQVNRKEIKSALQYFKSIPEVNEIVILSTCNRLEFYCVTGKGTDPFLLLNKYYKDWKGVNAFVSENNFYCYEERNTARHLFRVISGLDSMIAGEYQIQGQVKDAYSIACSEKTAGKKLHKLFHAAFRTGKAVRTQTRIGQGNRSLSGVAFKILNEKLNKTDHVTIIGVNQNTRVIAQKLNAAGFTHFTFVNRTISKAEKLAEKFGGNASSLQNIEKVLTGSKCIISCTGSKEYIISSDIFNNVYSIVKFPELIIDMAVPRDIDVRGINHEIAYYDLEGLSHHLEKEKKEIILDIPEAERIIDNESGLFEAWSEAQNYSNYNLLDEKIEYTRLQLLNELRVRLSEEDITLLDKFSRSLVHRLKSTITQVLKINLTDNEIYKAG